MSNVRNHFLISLASANTVMAINFAGAMVIARLLTPTEVGIFSVAYVFAGLLRTVREMGLGSYIVQETELTPERFRTAFGIALAIAALTGAILAAIAGLVGDFYREPGITQALYVIAGSFLLVPFGASTLSFLRRELQFKQIAVIDISGAMIQNAAAIALAYAGFSYMSLAWSSLIGIAGTILLIVFYRPKQLSWTPSYQEWRRVLGFSSYVSGSSLINYANASASDLLLGRLMNMEAVALFNRANSLAALIGPLILRASNAVSLPYFAQRNRAGESVVPGFLHATSLIVTLAVPIFIVLALVAEPLILLLFGAQWANSAPLLQILCFAAIAGMPTALTNDVMIAVGASRRQFSLDVQSLALKVAGIVLCAPYGLAAVAWSYGISVLLTSALRLYALSQCTGMRGRELLRALSPCLLPSAFSAIGPFILLNYTALHDYVLPLLCGLAAAAGWLLAVIAFRNPMGGEILALYRGRKQPGRPPLERRTHKR